MDDLVLEQRRRKGLHGTTVSEVSGIVGERHELVLAASIETMINGMSTILLDLGSTISLFGVKTAQTFEQRLYVSGVGHGAAMCDKSLRCKITCKGKGDPAGQPAVPRLDTHSANVAEGSGGTSLPC
eukprot:4895930-Pyramimonas_sp.AAC.1